MNTPRIEHLGEVTAPSGGLMLVDTGLLGIWCHDRPPRFPEGRADAHVVDAANASVDYRIEGPDAAAAARLWTSPNHPLYLYDRPAPPQAKALMAKFNASLQANGLVARLTPSAERISHRRRIDLLLDHSPRGGELF